MSFKEKFNNINLLNVHVKVNSSLKNIYNVNIVIFTSIINALTLLKKTQLIFVHVVNLNKDQIFSLKYILNHLVRDGVRCK